MSNKVTVRSQFESVREFLANAGQAELAEFIDGRIAQLDKRGTAIRKPSAKQIENDGVKNSIIEWMEYDTDYTSKSVVETCPACAGMTVNRVAALLSQLGKNGSLNVREEKHTKIYTLA